MRLQVADQVVDRGLATFKNPWMKLAIQEHAIVVCERDDEKIGKASKQRDTELFEAFCLQSHDDHIRFRLLNVMRHLIGVLDLLDQRHIRMLREGVLDEIGEKACRSGEYDLNLLQSSAPLAQEMLEFYGHFENGSDGASRRVYQGLLRQEFTELCL